MPSEASFRLGISPKTLMRWSDQGRIRGFRTVGGHRRYAATDIERLARELAQARADLISVEVEVPLPPPGAAEHLTTVESLLGLRHPAVWLARDLAGGAYAPIDEWADWPVAAAVIARRISATDQGPDPRLGPEIGPDPEPGS